LQRVSKIAIFAKSGPNRPNRPKLCPQVVRSIHSKCRLLLEALSLIVSPLSVLYKTTLDVVKPKLTPTAPMKENEELALWLHLFRPTLYHSPRYFPHLR
jgi:hypothetical protein